jgi:hypothetical protein
VLRVQFGSSTEVTTYASPGGATGALVKPEMSEQVPAGDGVALCAPTDGIRMATTLTPTITMTVLNRHELHRRALPTWNMAIYPSADPLEADPISASTIERTVLSTTELVKGQAEVGCGTRLYRATSK